MRTLRLISFLVLAAFILGTVSAQLPVPLGDDFPVSTTVVENQEAFEATTLATLSDGSFVVAWEFEEYEYGDGYSNIVLGRHFASDGSPVGDEFSISGFKSEYQLHPRMAAAEDDSFIVVWESTGEIMARRYGSDGLPSGDRYEIGVNGNALKPDIGAAEDFVVVWEGSTDGSSRAISGRRLDSVGNPIGSIMRINTYTTGVQDDAKVAVAPDGSFAVVWRTPGEASDLGRARWFDSLGNGLGDDQLIDDEDPGVFSGPRVAYAGDRYLIVWSRQDADGDGRGALGRFWSPAGEPQGPTFIVNSYTTGNQGGPIAIGTDSDSFLVLWGSGHQSGVVGELLDTTGDRIGGEFVVNTNTSGTQWFYSFGTSETNFVVAWINQEDDEETETIRGRRFEWSLLIDGFESGDTSAWP